ncbi:MAG: GNAT family N-acetyltransferase [Rhodomicrobium sp.]
MTLIIKELSDSPEDFNTLTRFYNELYIANFPDPDERESLANMKRYLQLKQEGWYGKNSYHIILAFDGDKIVAASVSDYLAIPNCGIIEFILVDEAVRGRAFGKTVHDATVKAFNQDAQKQGHTSADGVVIELNDPFRVAPVNDNYDPFERAMIWDRWGYGRVWFA